ncbi:lonely Cys domain-containing protein [Streptomyces sp. NPDC020681]|uniref:lonely Cys domain-containing protein n=1 Tax=Streptomyces sp. NPDC020681 TaxID=3365083 RepID=UPI0037938679
MAEPNPDQTITVDIRGETYTVSEIQLVHLLIRLDSTLQGIHQKHPIVLVMKNRGALPQRLADATGRLVYFYDGPLTFKPNPSGGPSRIHFLERTDGRPQEWLRAAWHNIELAPKVKGALAAVGEPSMTAAPPTPSTSAPATIPASGPLASPAAGITPGKVLRELLSHDRLLHDPNNQPTGRRWTYKPADALRTIDTSTLHHYTVYNPGGHLQLSRMDEPPWGTNGAWVIVAVIDEHGRILGPNGEKLSHEDIAETIAADLKDRPHLPVVFAIPGLANRSPGLQRATARRLKAANWALAGSAGLRTNPFKPTTSSIALDDDPRNEQKPVGSVIRFDEPAKTVADQDDEEFTDIYGVTFTRKDVAHSRVGDRHGTPALDHEHVPSRTDTKRLQHFREFTTEQPIVHVAGVPWHVGERRTVDPIPSAVRILSLHSGAGIAKLTVRGRTTVLSAAEAGRYFGTLQEFAELPDGVAIWLQACLGDQPGEISRYLGSAAGRGSRPVDDPLRTVSFAQHVANHSRRYVSGADRITGYGDTFRVNEFLPDGSVIGDRRWVRPEPTQAKLDALAWEYGLHADKYSEVPDTTRETVLALFRALRIQYGRDIEDDEPRFNELMNGIVALDTLRALDPLGQLTPFRLDLWNHLAREVQRTHPTIDNPHTAVLRVALRRIKEMRGDHGLRGLSPSLDSLRGPGGNSTPSNGHLQIALGKFERPGYELGKSLPEEVVRARALWALADAEQLLRTTWGANIAAWGPQVLHLAPGTPIENTHRAQIGILIAKAIEQRLPATNPTVLAALRAWENGIASRIYSAIALNRPGIVHWNLVRKPDPEPQDAHRVLKAAAGELHDQPAPWESGDKPLFLWAERNDDGQIPFPNVSTHPNWITDDELVELVTTIDETLAAHHQKHPIVLAMPNPGTIPQRIANRTGRHVHYYDTTTPQPTWKKAIWHRLTESKPTQATTAHTTTLGEIDDDVSDAETEDSGYVTGDDTDTYTQYEAEVLPELFSLAELKAAQIYLAPEIEMYAELVAAPLPAGDLKLTEEQLGLLRANRAR